MIDRRRFCSAVASLGGWPVAARTPTSPALKPRLPILVYHRFGARAVDSMTVRIDRFNAHLDVLQHMGCQVLALQDWVNHCRGVLPAPPPRSVVITADDGHRSQYEVMAPLLMKRGWSATLFVYPSAISNARYALSWPQLKLLSADGFSVQSHTYWHPNLLRERGLQAPADFRRFVTLQLLRSKSVIEDRLGREVSMLAWPFGLSDADLHEQARQEGWRAAFGLANRSAHADDDLYDQPRWLVTDAWSPGRLGAVLSEAFEGSGAHG